MLEKKTKLLTNNVFNRRRNRGALVAPQRIVEGYLVPRRRGRAPANFHFGRYKSLAAIGRFYLICRLRAPIPTSPGLLGRVPTRRTQRFNGPWFRAICGQQNVQDFLEQSRQRSPPSAIPRAIPLAFCLKHKKRMRVNAG